MFFTGILLVCCLYTNTLHPCINSCTLATPRLFSIFRCDFDEWCVMGSGISSDNSSIVAILISRYRLLCFCVAVPPNAGTKGGLGWSCPPVFYKIIYWFFSQIRRDVERVGDTKAYFFAMTCHCSVPTFYRVFCCMPMSSPTLPPVNSAAKFFVRLCMLIKSIPG